jgi:hypothetical protein
LAGIPCCCHESRPTGSSSSPSMLRLTSAWTPARSFSARARCACSAVVPVAGQGEGATGRCCCCCCCLEHVCLGCCSC